MAKRYPMDLGLILEDKSPTKNADPFDQEVKKNETNATIRFSGFQSS